MMLHHMYNNGAVPVRPVTIGKMGRVYGVLGWVKIITFTDKAESIFTYNPWFIYFRYKWRLIYLEKWKLLGASYIVKIRDFSDRESAKLLMHRLIIVESVQLPHLSDGEYYRNDLMGCKVVTDTGKYLGCIVNIIETTANDVLVIKISENIKIDAVIQECLIPFIPETVIKQVNINNGMIIVHWDINF